MNHLFNSGMVRKPLADQVTGHSDTGQCSHRLQTPLSSPPWSVGPTTLLTGHFGYLAQCEMTVSLCAMNWPGQSWEYKIAI